MSSAGGRAGHMRGAGAVGWQYLVSMSRARGLSGVSKSVMWLLASLVRDMPSLRFLMIMTVIMMIITRIKERLIIPATSMDCSIDIFGGARWGSMIWLIDVVIGVIFDDNFSSGI